MPNFFLDSLWPGLTVWILLYISDYAMTLKCARLYQAGVNERLVFGGSYEITPFFQRDIDTLRVVSPRFIAILFLNAFLLSVVWLLAKPSLLQMYYFLLGAMILSQLAVHMRHLRNLFLFRAILRADQVRGRIEYARPLMLHLSSFELVAFSGLFFLLFVFTQSWFTLGGATSCLSIALKHRRLARKQSSSAAILAESQQGT